MFRIESPDIAGRAPSALIHGELYWLSSPSTSEITARHSTFSAL
jgi:hypothetical protein